MIERELLIVIPCFKAKGKITAVIDKLTLEGFDQIIVVNDCCPNNSTYEIESKNVKIINTPVNYGVGGAFLHGVEYALSLPQYKEIKYISKMDADGQHNPKDLKNMLKFIGEIDCDIVKGNRYMLGRQPKGQPLIRKVGNVGLTFLSKLSTGYWDIGDPINGLIIFDKKFLNLLKNFKIEKRYLFESSVLYFSSFLNARVLDYPCEIIYADEESSLSIKSEFPRFLNFHIIGFYKRIIHDYLYPNFDLSFFGVIGALALPTGLILSVWHWLSGEISNIPTAPGILVMDMLLILLGYMSLIFFLQRDQGRKNQSFSVKKLLNDKE